MMGYDSRSVVAELLCNRYLANVPSSTYTIRLKWNLGSSDPSENLNPRNGSD